MTSKKIIQGRPGAMAPEIGGQGTWTYVSPNLIFPQTWHSRHALFLLLWKSEDASLPRNYFTYINKKQHIWQDEYTHGHNSIINHYASYPEDNLSYTEDNLSYSEDNLSCHLSPFQEPAEQVSLVELPHVLSLFVASAPPSTAVAPPSFLPSSSGEPLFVTPPSLWCTSHALPTSSSPWWRILANHVLSFITVFQPWH